METSVLTNVTVYDTNFTVLSRAVFETEVYWDLREVLTVVSFFILMGLVSSIIFLAVALSIFYKLAKVLISKGEPSSSVKTGFLFMYF